MAYRCGGCYKEVSDNAQVGQRCPHCGFKWGFERPDPGSPRRPPRPSTTPAEARMYGLGCVVVGGPFVTMSLVAAIRSGDLLYLLFAGIVAIFFAIIFVAWAVDVIRWLRPKKD